jgi:replicative DNA helicase
MNETLISWEAEEKIIGYLLNPAVKEESKISLLQLAFPEYFSNGKWKFLFDRIRDNKIFDKIVLWDKIKSNGFMYNGMPLSWDDLDNIDDFVTEKEVRSYIEILTDRYQKRTVYDFGREMQAAMLDGTSQFDVALKAYNVLSSMKSSSKIETNQQLLDRVLSERKEDVISTGFKFIDNYIGGYTRGMIITIAGDSGHMKTTLALDKALRMAEMNPKLRIGIFSKEMLAEDLIKKQISRICGIPISKIFAQDYDKEFVRMKMKEVSAWWENRITIINPASFRGVADIAKIQMAQKFDIWFLDFIQMLEFSKQATSSSDYNVQVGQNMRNLQSLALATKSIGVILSQVKKGIEQRPSKRPTVSDIEWSGLIKQLSSYIFFSYYPCKYFGEHKIANKFYYLLGEKTRFAESFTYPMHVNPAYGQFDEIESRDERKASVAALMKLTG